MHGCRRCGEDDCNCPGDFYTCMGCSQCEMDCLVYEDSRYQNYLDDEYEKYIQEQIKE